MLREMTSLAVLSALVALTPPRIASAAPPAPSICGAECLDGIARHYLTAYGKHDPSLAPIASDVRYSENDVEMRFPDGSWDTVSEEIGPPVIASDPSTGNVGIYTTIMQHDIPGFLAVRLRVVDGRITEIEHILSTRRNLSSPPTPIGDVHTFKPDPDLERTVSSAERVPRAEMIRLADGYFSTLQHNDGEIRGTKFAPDAARNENGMHFADIEKGFKLGIYRFNNRVRDRDYFLVDERRGLVMSRAFIDHKGVLTDYKLTDGKPMHSVFREPQTWSVLELFKIKNGEITSVMATFIEVPYYMRSPWTAHPDAAPDTRPAAPADPPSSAQSDPPRAADCGEPCLRHFMDTYLDALGHHDPSRLPLAAEVRFTENGVPIQLGQGLWVTFASLGRYRHDIYEPETGGVASFVSIRENDFPDLLMVRLRVDARRISEIETAVVRHASNAERMASVSSDWTRLWEREEPASTRLTREQLIDGVLGYFKAFAFVDGSRAPFAESCIRLENGMVMSLGPHDEPPLPLPPLSPAQASGREWFAAMRTTYGMGCTRQVDTGVYSFITGYANPRFPIVDTKRQIVFAVFNFRRRGTVKTVTMPNGKTYDMMPSTQWPNEVLNTEGWKFVNGKITRIEAVFKADQNFGAGTGWSGGLPGESRPVTTREARR